MTDGLIAWIRSSPPLLLTCSRFGTSKLANISNGLSDARQDNSRMMVVSGFGIDFAGKRQGINR